MIRRKTQANENAGSKTLIEVLEPYQKYFKGTSMDLMEGMFMSFKKKIDNLALNKYAMTKQITENLDLKDKLEEIDKIKRIVEIFEKERADTRAPSYIRQIIFKGAKKGDQIILGKSGIRIIASMFRAVSNKKKEKLSAILVDLSPELFHEWYAFKFYLSEHYQDDKIRKRFTQAKKEAIQLEIKKNLSHEIHSFLKFASTLSKPPQISEQELRLIGNFFVWAGLCKEDEFLINEDYAKIRLWIERAFIHLTPTKK